MGSLLARSQSFPTYTKGIAFVVSPSASHEFKRERFGYETRGYRYSNEYRFNSVVCAFSAWPDYP